MSKTVINTQEELNALSVDYIGEIVVTGGTLNSPIHLSLNYVNANVILSGTAVVYLSGSAVVNVMWGSSQVNVMWGSSQVNVMWGSSQVNVMWGSSQVNVMWGSSQVKEMWGSSMTKVLSQNCKIKCYGFNFIFIEKGYNYPEIFVNETSQLLEFSTFKSSPSIEFYLANYPIIEKDGILTMYKSVRVRDGEFYSDYDNTFEYPLGATLTQAVGTNISESCSKGLHVGHLQFAKEFGRGWENRAILELEVPKDKIIVSKDCDGKVRTSELRVVRVLDESEYN